jgi:hypothetical protein
LNSISIETGHERYEIQDSFLVDIVDHRLIRSFASSSHINICGAIEILGSACFCDCKSLSSISFESNSRLKRIESHAFSFSSLQFIEIPRNVRFIDGSAFLGVNLNSNSISIETGHERFEIQDNFLVDIVDHRLIRSFASSSHIHICGYIEILGSSCYI